MSDREATQKSSFLFILCAYTGHLLTANLVDKIVEELRQEATIGPTSWAFKGEKDD